MATLEVAGRPYIDDRRILIVDQAHRRAGRQALLAAELCQCFIGDQGSHRNGQSREQERVVADELKQRRQG